MIKSFADKRTAAVFSGYAVRGLPFDQRRARAKLLAVDAANWIDDLRVPPGNRLEALRGDRAGQHSIRVNDQWRICFVWENGEAWDVEIADYHLRNETMSIRREDVDARRVDFSDVRSGRRLPSVHPGEILRDEFLKPLGISVYELSKSLKVQRSRLNDVVLGRRAITTDTAIRLGRYLGTSPEFWMNLQARYDLDVAERTVRRRIEKEVSPRAA
ncbi:MAG TPA: HigA family addiction module antitoxin [Micropepsaceae bacterium]|nr:HigA family addiction module antitoxin [Micropepsaceae bacterium]